MANDFKIVLEIDSHKYKFLAKTIVEHKKTLQMLQINNILRESLLRDMRIIQNIIEKSEVIPKQEVANG